MSCLARKTPGKHRKAEIERILNKIGGVAAVESLLNDYHSLNGSQFAGNSTAPPTAAAATSSPQPMQTPSTAPPAAPAPSTTPTPSASPDPSAAPVPSTTPAPSKAPAPSAAPAHTGTGTHVAQTPATAAPATHTAQATAAPVTQNAEATTAPIWVPINETRACEKNSNGISRDGYMKNVSSLDACKAQCAARSDCVAVDYFTTTNWCNFYQKACNSPTDSHEGASSYRIQVPAATVAPASTSPKSQCPAPKPKFVFQCTSNNDAGCASLQTQFDECVRTGQCTVTIETENYGEFRLLHSFEQL
uniref:Apple domain-containing protein n=1 Tax=Eutreptiella gymnastica TaxID=73025 RepID=A0A7S4FXH2_9EUGL